MSVAAMQSRFTPPPLRATSSASASHHLPSSIASHGSDFGGAFTDSPLSSVADTPAKYNERKRKADAMRRNGGGGGRDDDRASSSEEDDEIAATLTGSPSKKKQKQSNGSGGGNRHAGGEDSDLAEEESDDEEQPWHNDDTQEYEVERILGRKGKDTKAEPLLYKIRWVRTALADS